MPGFVGLARGGGVLDDPELTHANWRRQDIAEIARRWGGSLPPGHIHIVTVPPPGAPKRLLLERFCSVIGVDPDLLDTDVASTNPSLNAPQAELLRRVNDALGDRLPDRVAGYHRLVNGYFAMQVLALQSGPPLKLPLRYADRTRELYERMAKQIRDQGYDVVAASSSEPDPDRFSWGHAVTWRRCACLPRTRK